MKLSIEPYTIQLKIPFRIAHGVSEQRHNVIAALEHDGLQGVGEGAAVVYHGETQAGITEYLEDLRRLPGVMDEAPDHLEDILQRLPAGSRAARAAFDFALHDLWGQRLGQPLYRLLGLNPQRIPLTSYTVGMDEPQAMAERARESGYPIIKVKLGSGDDVAMLAAIRSATPARLRVDANAGWSRQQAADLIPRLVEYDLEFVEQPLPVGDIEGLRWLRAELKAAGVKALIFADESVKSARDVAAHAGAVDGVVIKLMKTGGIREGLRAIHTARSLDMQVMLSCMVETSLGVTAAAHLATLCDYVDLDGPLLIANDPFEGVQYDGAHLTLPDRPGIGVKRRVSPPA